MSRNPISSCEFQLRHGQIHQGQRKTEELTDKSKELIDDPQLL
jgi:hypothetical protein